MDGEAGGQAPIPAADFLRDLHATARWVSSRSAPFFMLSHYRFLSRYLDAWVGDEPASADVAATIIGSRLTRLAPVRRLLGYPSLAVWVRRRTAAALAALVLWTAAVSLASAAASSLRVLKKGVRSVPPLITAVVVVFVTGDAWQILGAGFQPRGLVLTGVFLLASVLFLVRFGDFWDHDIAAADEECARLLRETGRPRAEMFAAFVARGAVPAPMRKVRQPGRSLIYAAYFFLSLCAVTAAAVLVALALVLVGVILIGRHETRHLAGSVHVYLHLPFGRVITSQLLSLSLVLGAFSALFLVAAQHSDDRQAFMDGVLARMRRALVVYSVYCRARQHAAAWTGVPVDWHEPPEPAQDVDRLARRVVRRGVGVQRSGVAAQAAADARAWARDRAAAEDVRYVARFAGTPAEFCPPQSLLDPGAPPSAGIAARCASYPGEPGWAEFQAAVRDLWAAVCRLTGEPEDDEPEDDEPEAAGDRGAELVPAPRQP
jgi:hypothetical protein